MCDPIGNAMVYAGLIVLAMLILQGLAAVLFGISLFAIIRRYLLRRKKQ